MKRFTEVSLGRRRAQLYRARSDRTPTRRGMLFAVVADKLDLYSAERRLEYRKMQFLLCPKSCVMRLQDSIGSRQMYATVHLPFYFNFRSLDLTSRGFLRDTLFHAIRKNGSYK